jgi:hypothetical protein
MQSLNYERYLQLLEALPQDNQAAFLENVAHYIMLFSTKVRAN